jgi:hypothetical protein
LHDLHPNLHVHRDKGVAVRFQELRSVRTSASVNLEKTVYFNSILYDVYQLCQYGRRLDPQVVKESQPPRGRLKLMRRFAQSNSLLAMVIDDRGREVVLPLVNAVVIRIKEGSMMIAGVEMHLPTPKARWDRATHYAVQRWLCKPVLRPELGLERQHGQGIERPIVSATHEATT